MKKRCYIQYDDVVSIENVLLAWKEFRCGKRGKMDVAHFERNLMTNVHALCGDLAQGVYTHGGYESFRISDPKPRHIHKASVRDRVVHHAIYRKLYPFFDSTFIADSYSCRKEKGTHKANERFQRMARSVSRNNTRTCWVLKCDIRQFFASIDHGVLVRMLSERVHDRRLLALLENVIRSFHLERQGVGLPLGNLTSQLFVNVYMNQFDQFVKHTLKVRHYIRYADDFVFLHHDKKVLEALVAPAAYFLAKKLGLELHPRKVSIQTLASGIDFLGWVHFPYHTVLRTVSKRRMFRRIVESPTESTVQSYRGLLQHGNTHKLQQEVENLYWILSKEE